METSSQPVSAAPIASPPNPNVVGDLRIHEFTSHIFRNRRNIRVWLPPGYDLPENSAQRYPVFYLNDGQNLFDPTTSFTGVEWQVDDTADRLIRAGEIPPAIFVGIDNAAVERLKEYLPYRSLNPVVLRPQGTKYSAFLTKEIMPFVGPALSHRQRAGEYVSRRLVSRRIDHVVRGHDDARRLRRRAD